MRHWGIRVGYTSSVLFSFTVDLVAVDRVVVIDASIRVAYPVCNYLSMPITVRIDEGQSEIWNWVVFDGKVELHSEIQDSLMNEMMSSQ